MRSPTLLICCLLAALASAQPPRPAVLTVEGLLCGVDADASALEVSVRRMVSEAGVEQPLQPDQRAWLQLGQGSLATVADGEGGLVAIEDLQPGWPLTIGLAASTASGAVVPVVSVAVTVPSETPRLPALAFRYTDQDPSLDPAEVLLTYPILGGSQWQDNYRRADADHPHYGIDLRSPKMTPLVAPFDGLVVLRKSPATPGNAYTLVIRGYGDYTALYTHLNDDDPGTTNGQGGERQAFAPGVRQGGRAAAGQLVGWVGDSGRATGPHLHLELRLANGDLRDPTLAARAATVLLTPRLAPLADDLVPPRGQVRLDGVVGEVDAGGGRIALDVRAERPDRDTWLPTVQPIRRWLDLPATGLQVLGLPDVLLPAEQLAVGQPAVLFVDGDRVSRGWAAAPGFWLQQPRGPALGPPAR